MGDVLEEIQKGWPWRGLILVVGLALVHSAAVFVIYFPSVGGFVPYTQWTCLSEDCRGRITEYGKENPDTNPYNSDTLCGKDGNPQLVKDTDFKWSLVDGRTTFAVDWDIYCDTEYRGTLLSSLYFVGATIGLLVGSLTFDTVGRRGILLVGYSSVAAGMFITALVDSLALLMAVRVMMGVGTYMGLSGMYTYILECTAIRLRGFVSSLIGLMWGVGLVLFLPLLSYLITSWKWMSAAGGFLMTAAVAVWFLVPPSPRHLLENRADAEGAAQSLQKLAKIFGKDLHLTSLDLKTTEKDDQASYLQTLGDFLKFREIRAQLLIQMFQWMVVAFLYYGFGFGWAKLGSNIYWSYMFAGLAEVLSSLICWFGQDILGRKVSMIAFFLVGSASFLLALVPGGATSVLTFEQLMCLVGAMCVSAAWATCYLYVAESSPTSHRGKMAAICSIAARIGSFAGPQASLLFTWSKPKTLVIFAVLAAAAGLVTVRLPETRGRHSPTTAQEVEERREEDLREARCCGW